MKPTTTISPSWARPLERALFFLLLWAGATLPGQAQNKVTFPATDSLSVTADLYPGKAGEPFLILLHSEGGSRGEYRDLAPRLVKMGYHCLAVDLRTGKESHFVSNETARRAATLTPPPQPLDGLKDIAGAIRYAHDLNPQKVVLLGSSRSASLALLQATRDTLVAAVIAFSPGEFFRPFVSVADSLGRLRVPVLITGSKQEYPYLKTLSAKIPPQNLTLFIPSRHDGEHGVRSLLPSDPASGEYWLSLLMFFRNMKDRTR